MDDGDWFDKYFSQLQQRKMQQNTSITKNDSYRDVNVSSHLHNRIMQQQAQSTGTCTLVPGAVFYRPLNAKGWPTKFPLVREGGTVPDNGQVFELKGEKKVLRLQGNEAIDFSRVDESSPNVVVLVEVSSLFVGTVLVEKSAIREMNGAGTGGKSILFG